VQKQREGAAADGGGRRRAAADGGGPAGFLWPVRQGGLPLLDCLRLVVFQGPPRWMSLKKLIFMVFFHEKYAGLKKVSIIFFKESLI